MIIRKNKTFEICSLYPNVNWYPNEDNYIIDETKEENLELINKIKQCSPYMDLIIRNGEIIDITPLEKPMIEPTIVDEVIDEEKAAIAEAIVMLESRIMELENKNTGGII